jgi:hypothetical protein
MKRYVWILGASLFSGSALAGAAADLHSTAEKNGFVRTARYAETIALCDAFERHYPGKVDCTTFGTTPEGRPQKAMIISPSGYLSPKTAKANKQTVLLIQGGIHAGEIDGKDAGFQVFRQMLDGELGKDILKNVVVVFVPVFNVDGHENFRAWNRPNQRGPEEMGFRTTAQRYNLNRDYLKVEAPEMRAMMGLVRSWDPAAEMDLHVTDGAKFQHDISITAEPVNSGDDDLQVLGRKVRDQVIDELKSAGNKPVAFYPSFDDSEDPMSGFTDSVSPPRFSNGYFVLRNRIGILVETHSWRTYPERVASTRTSIIGLVKAASRDGADWQARMTRADQRAATLGGSRVAVTYDTDKQARTIDFLGYAYARTKSAVSGDLMTRYDESTPEVWKLPLRDVVHPSEFIVAPKGGYVVFAAWRPYVQPVLDAHGVTYSKIEQGTKAAAVETFRADEAKFAATSFEGHQRLTLKGQWKAENYDIPAGSLYVPVNQALSRVVINLFEPAAPDALVGWGVFNNAFESKEYMEPYVAEEEAEKMLAKDPALKKAFEARLAQDPAFAKSPSARLNFFYRRHAAFDSKLNLYPVVRTDKALTR